ncbi:hypothetical protein K1719_043694 [Acacia pycnantha]|nr:hypothetical protein K1719_043694 [Acacia pycnantha]
MAEREHKSKWDDEDVDENDVKESCEDENDVKESWEDEDEPASAPAPPSPKPIGKAPKKSSEKATGKKGKKVVIEKEEPVGHLAEKSRQQRLVEEVGYKSTKLFGNKSDEKNLNNFIPKSESDFLEYAELISHKLRPFEKSYHYMNLLKTVMKLSLTSLKGSEVEEIVSSITSIAKEKIKAEKEANISAKKKLATEALQSLMSIIAEL